MEDAKEGNAKALDILNRGVDSLGFHFCGDCVSKEFVETLLEGIECECVELNFCTCKRRSVELANILVEYFAKKGYDKERIAGSIDWDPIEKMAMKGKDALDDIDVLAIANMEPTAVEALRIALDQIEERVNDIRKHL